jgi:DNA-binding response OmpR family regulator
MRPHDAERALTVVVADDDADIRSLIVIAVKKAGLTLLAALPDGSTALDAMVEHKPDIALLDVSMPGLSGLEVAQAIRQDASLEHCLIFILSAAVDDTAVAAGFAAGADAYMTKPFSPSTLAAQLRALIADEQLAQSTALSTALSLDTEDTD